MYSGVNYQFVSDRRGAANMAVYLNRGSLQAPSGTYFTGALTITCWINLRSNGYWGNIVVFGTNVQPIQNLIAMEMHSTSGKFYFWIEFQNYIVRGNILFNKINW